MSKNIKLPSKADDFSGWYREVVTQAKVAMYSPVEGCMAMRPEGYAIWANICNALKESVEKQRPRNIDEMHQTYRDFCRDVLAIPVLPRLEPEDSHAEFTWWPVVKGLISNEYSIRADAADYLDDILLEMAKVDFSGYESIGQVQMSDWEFIAHLIEAVIITHGDDKGLILPPSITPTQVLIVPITFEMRTIAYRLEQRLLSSGIRAKVDGRSNVRVGMKSYESKLHGIPLLIKVGPAEAAHGKVLVISRHNGGEYTPSFRNSILYSFPGSIRIMLETIQNSLLERAAEGS